MVKGTIRACGGSERLMLAILNLNKICWIRNATVLKERNDIDHGNDGVGRNAIATRHAIATHNANTARMTVTPAMIKALLSIAPMMKCSTPRIRHVWRQ